MKSPKVGKLNSSFCHQVQRNIDHHVIPLESRPTARTARCCALRLRFTLAVTPKATRAWEQIKIIP